MSARNPDFRTVAVCVLHDLTSIFKHFLALVLFEIFFFFMWERERDFLVFFFFWFSLSWKCHKMKHTSSVVAQHFSPLITTITIIKTVTIGLRLARRALSQVQKYFPPSLIVSKIKRSCLKRNRNGLLRYSFSKFLESPVHTKMKLSPRRPAFLSISVTAKVSDIISVRETLLRK